MELVEIFEGSWRVEGTLRGWGIFAGKLGAASSNAFIVSRSVHSPDSLRGSEQLAIQWLVDSAESLALAASMAIFNEYPSIKSENEWVLDEVGPDEAEQMFPDAPDAVALAKHLSLSEVVLHDVTDGLPKLGIVFDAPWDAEHQLGVLFCGEKVLGVGDGDYACYP
ncbi:MAG: hypothetical protein KC561_01595 [Myxococcales bacterium]|nr:hypothetical protein [Myxococcales bacterium]